MGRRRFQIYRFDPDTDAKPRMQTLEVAIDGVERMLLDAQKLRVIDPSQRFRRVQRGCMWVGDNDVPTCASCLA